MMRTGNISQGLGDFNVGSGSPNIEQSSFIDQFGTLFVPTNAASEISNIHFPFSLLYPIR